MHLQDLNKSFRRYFNFPVPFDPITNMIVYGPNNAHIDIIKLDTELAKRDPEYDPDNCKYQDKENISMKDYIRIKYGEEAMQFVEKHM